MTSAWTRSAEERANSISHGVGFLLALAATPVLILGAVERGGAADIVGSSIFGASLALLYLTSACYHAAAVGPRKQLLQRLDHAAIYLLIAGTYTPFTLGVLGGGWGWTLFGLVWGAAAAGVLIKLRAGIVWPRLSTALYVAMGWLVLVAIAPLVRSMDGAGLAWLFAGGVFYTGGIVFYATDHKPYRHFTWHLFVLAGSACHVFAVLWYAAGR